MANRNNVTTNVPSEDNDDIDNIPDEMDDSRNRPSMSNAATNGNTSSAEGMSLDDLDAKGFNEARDEQLRAAMDPPAGDWFKSTRAEWEKRVYVNDTMPDDLDPAGRTFFNFTVEVDSRTVGEHTYTPKLFLRMSPDARFKMDEPEKIDMAHKLWLRAKDLYLSVKEEKPTIRKLIMFLSEDDYILRTMKGDNSPVVVDVKRKVERRQTSRR
jgi:hypothetical protein